MSGDALLLAVESATAVASVAILRGESVLAERSGRSGQHHSETLLPMIDAVLAEAGCRIPDIDAFAVSIGPGAFTSLRIGLATLKGLAFAHTAPVAAVSTLEALAEAALERSDFEIAPGTPIVPLLDARRGEAYAAIYRAPGTAGAALERVMPDCVSTPEALAASLPPGAVLVGEGVALFAARISEAAGSGVAAEPLPTSIPAARSVARVARRLLADGAGEPADRLVPRYLRRAEAEVTRTGQAFESP